MAKQKSEQTSIAKIVVISRVYDHLACTVVRVDWILTSKLNGLLGSELVSRLYPTRQTSNKDTINHGQDQAI